MSLSYYHKTIKASGYTRNFHPQSQKFTFQMTQTPKKPAHELRSQQWFGRQDRDGFAYRSWVKGKGVPHDQFDGRPVIGICNTFSELTPCNSHFRTLGRASQNWRL